MKQHHIVEGLFPLEPKHKLEERAGSIKQSGQRLPVVTYQGDILDGWNRYNAMRLLGWTHPQMKFTEFKGTTEEALRFVVDLNLERRHQSSSDLLTIAARIAASQHAKMATEGRPRKDTPVRTQAEEAADLHVSTRTLRRHRAKRAKTTTPVLVSGVLTDPFGHEIPPAAMGYWVRRMEVTELVKLAKSLAHKIKALSKDDPMWRRVPLQALEAKANAVAFDFNSSMPYCLCPVCLGQDPENCRLCDGRGVITEHLYTTGVPKETRDSFEAIKTL